MAIKGTPWINCLRIGKKKLIKIVKKENVNPKKTIGTARFFVTKDILPETNSAAYFFYQTDRIDPSRLTDVE